MLVSALSVTSALASNVHFKKGGTPTCTISGAGTTASATCTGSVAGLGGEDVTIDVTLGGFAVYQCQNPSDKKTPPGQNRVLVGPTTTPTTISSGEIKNGNLTFVTDEASLSAADTVTSQEAGCPGANWTGVNPTLTVTDISLTFFQGGQQIFTCSASDPNGLSSKVTFTNCTFS